MTEKHNNTEVELEIEINAGFELLAANFDMDGEAGVFIDGCPVRTIEKLNQKVKVKIPKGVLKKMSRKAGDEEFIKIEIRGVLYYVHEDASDGVLHVAKPNQLGKVGKPEKVEWEYPVED